MKAMNTFFFFFSFILLVSAVNCHRLPRRGAIQPCKTMSFFFHDILYNGRNSHNATSAIVASPAWGDRIKLGPFLHFGDVIVIDNPITLGNSLSSPAVGRAQGLYLYDRKDVITAWMAFTLVFNSSRHRGTINLIGADTMMDRTRDLSVAGGTGDFFMARGTATLTTDAIEGDVYFRVRVEVKLYECY